MTKGKKIWLWVASLFLLSGTFAYFPHPVAIGFGIAGILCLPIEKLQNFIGEKFHIHKLKGVIAAILFFVCMIIAPNLSNSNITLPKDNYVASSSNVTISSNQIEGSKQSPVTSSLSQQEQVNNVESNTIEDTTVSVPSVTLPADSTFNIQFIDVGQADAALIDCDGHYMLIDGGNRNDSNKIYSILKSKNISKLDIVVGTHSHEDHIGGIPGAFNYTTADITLCPVTNYDSKAFENFKKYADQKGNRITIPNVGDTYPLGSSLVTILGVNSSSGSNNSSIVLRIDYGKTSFLFTGDAEREAEQVILNSGANLDATVLKVGHHGSDTSTTYPFLREIMPQYAVISCGVNNSYGHPSEDTLSRLRDADVKVFRTDMQGDIYCTSDGETVQFTVDKNNDADVLGNAGSTSSGYNTENKVTQDTSEKITPSEQPPVQNSATQTYVLNTNTGKFHYPTCRSAAKIKPQNRQEFTGTRDELIAQGYSPCGNCHP